MNSKIQRAVIGTVLLFTIGLLSYCGQPPSKIEPYTITSIIDFQKYADRGFLITRHEYKGKYESRGNIWVEAMPGAEKATKKVKEYYDYEVDEKKIVEWKAGSIDFYAVMDSLYMHALRMKADAVIDFEMTPLTKYYNVGEKKPVRIDGWRVGGFAIKRLDVK